MQEVVVELGKLQLLSDHRWYVHCKHCEEPGCEVRFEARDETDAQKHLEQVKWRLSMKNSPKKRMRFWSCATCAPFFDEGSKQTTTIAADPPAQPMRPPALDQPDVAVVAFAEGPRARPSPWSMKGSQLCQKGAISFRTGRFSCWRDVSDEVVLQSRPRRRRSRRTRSTLRSAPPSTAIEQGGPESGCFSCQRDVSEEVVL